MKGITLIGMPGSGKSTIGKMLADISKRRFVDLDILILEKEGRGHADILEKDGKEELLRLEEKYTLGIDLLNTVFSPGGSIVYSDLAMKKMERETEIFYFMLPVEEIKRRLGDKIDSRGIVGLKERGIKKLFQERDILYRKFSDKIIDCEGLSKKEIMESIQQFLI